MWNFILQKGERDNNVFTNCYEYYALSSTHHLSVFSFQSSYFQKPKQKQEELGSEMCNWTLYIEVSCQSTLITSIAISLFSFAQLVLQAGIKR